MVILVLFFSLDSGLKGKRYRWGLLKIGPLTIFLIWFKLVLSFALLLSFDIKLDNILEFIDGPICQIGKLVLIGAKLYELFCIITRVNNILSKILLFCLYRFVLHLWIIWQRLLKMKIITLYYYNLIKKTLKFKKYIYTLLNFLRVIF